MHVQIVQYVICHFMYSTVYNKPMYICTCTQPVDANPSISIKPLASSIPGKESENSEISSCANPDNPPR